jgi:hypothetical protein
MIFVINLYAGHSMPTGGDRMGYLEGLKWDTIKKDPQQGLGKGMAAVNQGAVIVLCT